ncbi:MAG TPA: DNA-3-methyladenine glycosylase [Lachnospiraceae bacterium]|nr:DNA-3-methyladenine glycosylase [uncultured Lachnoclostridium sp.]HAU85397.1 DNA-3-methyladenine glycosylase [Lachnospiraceae bacterium]
MGRLSQDFFMDDAVEVAKKLLGKILVHETKEGITKCRIVETEAYMGVLDKGSHAYSGKVTKRTATLYEQGGVAYVYLIYGMYHCMNVVVNVKGLAQGVLIRALEPLEGIELMKKRRKLDKVKNLCNGPGKLCIAMDITKKENGVNLMTSSLFIEDAKKKEPFEIVSAKRINIDYAEEAKDFLWRFYIKDTPYVSVKSKE